MRERSPERSAEAWRAKAACAEKPTEMWFPLGSNPYPPEARDTCRACPVRTECLEFAMAASETFGMWGGMTPRERAALARERRWSRVVIDGKRLA